MARAKVKPTFIEPMLLEAVAALPENRSTWRYELKLDGYRAVAFKSGGVLSLRSRNDNDFSLRYPAIAQALSHLPNDSAIDGEIVALDREGRPSFNLLQNHGSTHPDLFYYVFDLLIVAGNDVRGERLDTRRDLLESRVLPTLSEPVRLCPELCADLPDLVRSVREQRLEGLVAKRRDSLYESGLRSGAWQKMRVTQGQEFVIGGYTVGGKTFDALILGYYDEGRFLYASRTRNGFTPALREQLFKQMKPLLQEKCLFANLPEPRGGRWGQGLTAVKMKECRWLQPKLVGQFEFWNGPPTTTSAIRSSSHSETTRERKM